MRSSQLGLPTRIPVACLAVSRPTTHACRRLVDSRCTRKQGSEALPRSRAEHLKAPLLLGWLASLTEHSLSSHVDPPAPDCTSQRLEDMRERPLGSLCCTCHTWMRCTRGIGAKALLSRIPSSQHVHVLPLPCAYTMALINNAQCGA